MPDQFSLLLEWRRNESAVRGLSKLPHDFYATTAAYLAEVRRSYEADLRENPSGRKGELARQTYQRASQLARDVVEGRAQKVVTAAFQASIGGARDLPNALSEERSLFDQVLRAILEHRRTAAPYLEPSGAAAAPGPTARTPPPPSLPPAPSAPAPTPPATPPPAAKPGLPRTDLRYLRILKGGRPIEVGVETLDLRTDDLVSLPAEIAKLLIDAAVAEPVSVGPERPTT